MSIEERLSDALHGTFDGEEPAPGLEARILDGLPEPRRRLRWVGAPPPIRAAIALIVVAVLVSLAIAARPGEHPRSDRPVAGGAITTSGIGSPAAPPSMAWASFDAEGLAFGYPATWHVSHAGLNEHYVTVLDFLGTGSGSAACWTYTPGPSDSFTSGSTCQTSIELEAGQVVVALQRSDGPPRPGPIDPSDPRDLPAGERFVTVGGLPAIAGQTADHPWGSDLALTWTLSVPAQLISRYEIDAYIKGPDVAATRAQVEALVASIEYDPPVPVLDRADAGRALGIGLAQMRAGDPSFACFPTVPDTSASATITYLPGSAELRKPLPVTCTTTIAPRQIGLWEVTLTESWTAAADRTAGRQVTTLWLAADGTPGTTQVGPSDTPPYLP